MNDPFSLWLKEVHGAPKTPAIAELKQERDIAQQQVDNFNAAISALQKVCKHRAINIDISTHKSEDVDVCEKCGVEL